MSRCVSALAAGVVAVTLVGWAGTAASAPPSGAELAALSAPPTVSSLASQRIYFVMPDRYANAVSSNDRGGQSGQRNVTGYDPTDFGYFHGGDLVGLREGLPRIKQLGFTALWVTPVLKQQAVQGDSAAYHGYWGLDFTTVDPHLGSDEDFADLVQTAHRLGLKVYLDVVVNHTADVIALNGTSYTDAPFRDCKGRAFNPARYVARAFPCLTAVNMPRVPVPLAGDAHKKRPEWLNDPLRYHDRGDIDFGSCNEVCFEQGDFFGLDDLFTEQPAVVNGLARVYSDWITRFKVDGFRVDTAKHVNAAFFRLWVPKIRAAARSAGIDDFPIFGEVTLNDAVDLAPFVRDRGLPTVLDFPFQSAAADFVSGQSTAKGLAHRLEDDDYFRTANGVEPTPPTFLGNHDMGRAAFQIQSRSGGDHLLQRVLLGYDALYLLRGAPVVSYGDEVGMIGSGGDKAAREDMFPTQVAQWRTEPRAGSGPIGSASSLEETTNPIQAELKTLAKLRDSEPALSIGASIVRFASGGALVVSRIDAAAKREYLAAFNAGSTPVRVTVRTSTPSTTWTGLLGAGARSGGDGKVTLQLPGLSAALLRAETSIPVAAPPRPVLKAAADDLTALMRVSATLGSITPVTVTFATKRGGGAWTRLGVDDSPPYRVFAQPKRLRGVSVLAVARSLDGRTAVSRLLARR